MHLKIILSFINLLKFKLQFLKLIKILKIVKNVYLNFLLLKILKMCIIILFFHIADNNYFYKFTL